MTNQKAAPRPLPFVVLLAATVLTATTARGDQPQFVRHDLNAASQFSACAAFDVNRDGKTDIFCGSWWYEAPDWKRHFVRDVAMIRGRFDGYSHLPMDVNGDGWTDVINANYRSQAIYWIESPGAKGGPWSKRIVDTPGPMETGRLVDVDGDGTLDLLPNGVRFAAWWELRRGKKAGEFDWLRHDLPPEVGGHGVGFGDIDGDGRGDIVGPAGWLQAPKDRRAGRWHWHAEWELPRGASVPIYVTDVDEDGDADLVWARGHDIGVYWTEQAKDADGERHWIQHAIDTEWSQSHSPLLADIDNDGRVELVTGKRFMAHDGKDPGAYDPLVIYSYDFNPKSKTWQRSDIQTDGPAGFGLDPKAVDLDGDGDVDLVAAGRSGLYWFENLLIHQGARPPAEERAGPAFDHTKLLAGSIEGKREPVTSAADWGRRRASILKQMESVMGRRPNSARRVPLEVKIEKTERADGYARHYITFAAEPNDRVPAWLLVPNGLRERAPAMLCLHQTTRIGKDEPAGLGGRESLHYADELASRGFICIVPDYPSFGDYSYDFAKDDYTSGSMKAIWNNMRAIDVLEARPDVSVDRIGVIGHSLGGHNSLFTAAFDQRLQAVVTSCGFTAFHHYYKGNLTGWTSDRYMPAIRTRFGSSPDAVPFDFYEVLGAVAPRSIFVNAPLHDSNFEVTGVRKVEKELRALYGLLRCEDRLNFQYPDSGHDFPPAIREAAYDWLARQLK